MSSIAQSPSKRRRAVADENESSLDNVPNITPSKVARRAVPKASVEMPSNNHNRAEAGVAIPHNAALVPVTPSSRLQDAPRSTRRSPNARRNILPRDGGVITPGPGKGNNLITPSKDDYEQQQQQPAGGKKDTPPAAKRRLMFGRLVAELPIQTNTKLVYSMVKKLTGSIGGNGSCGPIYGELTIGSMQRMVNLMKEHTGLNNQSRFIDVGSGIGKPNLHVAQDPGVAFSCGIEMELDRWRLGLKCLQKVLHEASAQGVTGLDDKKEERILHNCMMIHGNIMEASTFDPFTHVYMFSIGFPPALWVYLSEAWNRSKSPYMICFHSPRAIIDTYEFDVELLVQMPTSMHGSKEGHTGYIYQRKGLHKKDAESYVNNAPCDKVFLESYDRVKAGLGALREAVDKQVEENWSARRSMTRSVARKQGVILSKTTDT